jgi:pyruvate dehydrogenase E2 component (dihydrolipoamide acetyltransferase)
VTIDGGRRLRVLSWPGHGRPLVLLHGLLDSSEGWEALAADTHRPCVAIDLPGFGGSDPPDQARIESYARDVVAGLERLGIEDCTLVGHSLGGAVAAAAAERTRAVKSLALLAPAGFGPIRLADAFALPGVHQLAMRALPLALATPPVVAAAYMTFVAPRRLPPAELLLRLRSHAWRAGPGVRAAVLALADSGHAPDALYRRRLSFDGPVAALWGEQDGLVPLAHIDGLRTALPQAHVEIWPRMGHHPQRERPVELARFIELRASRARRRRRLERPTQDVTGTARAA